MRVLCVALWRTRPSVLFVLEARFSQPIDRTPCFNANPHRRSPPFAAFPPPPPPPQPPFPILLRSCTYRDEDIGPRGYLDSGYRLLKNRCLINQAIFYSAARRRSDFSNSAFRTLGRSQDDRKPARPIALTTSAINTTMANR